MEGQSGIGTILVMIAIILTAVVVAILLVQTADELRVKARSIQKEQERMLLDRVMIKEVKGVTNICGSERCVTHLLIKAALYPGSNPMNLEKTTLSVITEDEALEGIRYVKPEDLPTEFSDVNGDPERNELIIIADYISNGDSPPQPACRATLINAMRRLNRYSLDYITYVMDPFPPNSSDPRIGSFYTVLWTDCYDKGDTVSLLRDQEIMIFYRLRSPLYPASSITLEMGHAQGYKESKELMLPRGFEGKIVKIFP